MSKSIETLQQQIKALSERVQELATRDETLLEDINHIELDLSNTIDEFVATSGKDPEAFYPWRRKAKWALVHKQKERSGVKEDLIKTKQELTNAQMALYAEEAGYRGSDPELLLRAMYYLTMDVLQSTGFQPDSHSLGLLAAVKERTERTAPERVL